MRDMLKWRDEYAVGLPEIDAQHRYFLSLLEELDTLSEAVVSDRVARQILREVDRYAYYHFNSEEVLMGIYRYPDVENQKRDHFNLLQVLDKKICDFRHQGTTVGPLVEFLGRWFFSHINEDDRELARFIIRARSERRGVNVP
ncbi:MAG: hypothetical protein EA402_00300 [Planctomycetota bacterium]|nr:MAG: hypothetical protein EA402_00300 [Planctomycetota bacterium]